MKAIIRPVKDRNILEVVVSYGNSIVYRVRKPHVTIENLQLKLNEIFMSGQSTVDVMWKKSKEEIEKRNITGVFYIEVKHDGLWLVKTSMANVQRKLIPKMHDQLSTAIMRGLDQMAQGKPPDGKID